MDPARLAEIEKYLRGEHPSLVWRPEELIAALRTAWVERDKAEKREGSYFGRITASDLRADRAEADLEKLAKDWNDLREAAEAVFELDSYQHPAWETLRRALDACAQDPAR